MVDPTVYNRNMISIRQFYSALLLTIILLVGFALFAQHQWGLEPCPLCMVQRMAFIAIAMVVFPGLVFAPTGWGNWLISVPGFLFAVLGAVVAGRHLWLQSLPADQVPACGPGLEFILDAFPLNEAIGLILGGSGECAEQLWSFLGLSMPGWALVWFLLFAIVLWLPVVPVRGKRFLRQNN